MSGASAISVEQPLPGVCLIRMQDRQSKNTFSGALTQGLMDAFAHVQQQTEYKVVVLTGYDNYFASGGTQEDLLQLSEGKGSFSDRDLYSLALNCEIPVISAMQGHGIGGGFVLGLFADMVILSRESVYTTNFMKYGFTPGMGATMIVPKKLGIVLAEEMLLGAANYRGAELKERGIPFTVLPRDQVLPKALEMAALTAEKPRHSLVTLKSHLVAQMRQELPSFIAKEVAMHDSTFGQPEVRERINSLFGS
jgi:polyketide biosynthesis enoyl-CoA hydratase PksI